MKRHLRVIAYEVALEMDVDIIEMETGWNPYGYDHDIGWFQIRQPTVSKERGSELEGGWADRLCLWRLA